VNLTTSYLTQPADGELSSGDAVVVRRDEDANATLIAMIDVLGHGGEAAKVAKVAIHHLREAPIERATTAMMSLHEVLRGSRGAAASICVIRGTQIDGCGVGNVEMRVLGTPLPILLTPGIIGQRLHRLRSFDGHLAPGDRLVFYSDGISSQVPFAELRTLSPGEACAVVMRNHRRRYDDATVLISDLGP